MRLDNDMSLNTEWRNEYMKITSTRLLSDYDPSPCVCARARAHSRWYVHAFVCLFSTFAAFRFVCLVYFCLCTLQFSESYRFIRHLHIIGREMKRERARDGKSLYAINTYHPNQWIFFPIHENGEASMGTFDYTRTTSLKISLGIGKAAAAATDIALSNSEYRQHNERYKRCII